MRGLKIEAHVFKEGSGGKSRTQLALARYAGCFWGADLFETVAPRGRSLQASEQMSTHHVGLEHLTPA
jgi:hypothetical protein